MNISDKFSIVKRENENYLVNIEDGDVYYINGVTIDIVESCDKYDSIEELCDFIYSKYSDVDECTKEELVEFVNDMIKNEIILL